MLKQNCSDIGGEAERGDLAGVVKFTRRRITGEPRATTTIQLRDPAGGMRFFKMVPG